MKRLTFREPDGTYGIVGMNDENMREKVFETVLKLKLYEDTGLSPEQVKDIDNMYLDKCKEVNKLNDRIKELELCQSMKA